MHELRTLLDQVMQNSSATSKRDPREIPARARAVQALFLGFREKDAALAEHYARETMDIPWWLFRLTIRGIIRSRVYPQLPTVGELYEKARAIAGMDRDQYRAGYQVGCPKRWPPRGKRHGANAGEYEALPAGEPLRLKAAKRREIGSGE